MRENFLKKKLGLTNPNAAIDAAINAVSDKMKGDYEQGYGLLFAGRSLRKATNPELAVASLSRFLLQQATHGAIFHHNSVLAFHIEA